ncbi:MAG: hypothetical protein R2795_24005 [Saprospiraceae bacterium]
MGQTDTNPKTAFELPERQWEYLLDRLEKEETILFIGPGLLPFPGADSVEDALFDYLQEKSQQEALPFISKFYRDDKFFMLNERDKDESLWNFMSYYRDFFEEKKEDLAEARALLAQVAKLPFSTIITLCPDALLEEAYGDQFAFHADFYNKKKKPQPYLPGRMDDPLIYYLRGRMTVDESMIISHSDLFDYLESIYEAKSMDADLKQTLKSAKYYIFLGLPLESWYMQLLLRLFDFHLLKPRILAMKHFQEKDLSKRVVYEDLYNVNFHDHSGGAFLQELFQRCEAKGMVKQATGNAVQANFERDAEAFQSLLRAGHHEQSLANLEELSVKYLPQPAQYASYFNTLTLGASNYRSAHRNYNINLITYEQFKVEETRLVAFLNMQFEELKSLIHGQ